MRMLDAYGFEVPVQREREYEEWSGRYYRQARHCDRSGHSARDTMSHGIFGASSLGSLGARQSAEEAQIRRWLLHLVKFKGDEGSAYIRSPELTAIVRQGIPSERIPRVRRMLSSHLTCCVLPAEHRIVHSTCHAVCCATGLVYHGAPHDAARQDLDGPLGHEGAWPPTRDRRNPFVLCGATRCAVGEDREREHPAARRRRARPGVRARRRRGAVQGGRGP